MHAYVNVALPVLLYKYLSSIVYFALGLPGILFARHYTHTYSTKKNDDKNPLMMRTMMMMAMLKCSLLNVHT